MFTCRGNYDDHYRATSRKSKKSRLKRNSKKSKHYALSHDDNTSSLSGYISKNQAEKSSEHEKATEEDEKEESSVETQAGDLDNSELDYPKVHVKDKAKPNYQSGQHAGHRSGVDAYETSTDSEEGGDDDDDDADARYRYFQFVKAVASYDRK